MSKKPSWNDFQEAKPSELKKTYNLNDRQLEQSYRKHLVGASTPEYRKEYEKLYRRNRRDA